MFETTYFDPQTGERISEETYKQRYGLAAFLGVRFTPHGIAADAPGLPPFGPRCPDCGASVSRDGELCAQDAMKREAKAVPVFVRELAPQPEPAYVKAQREAETRVTGEESDSYPPGTVLGGASSGDAQ